MNIGIVSTYPPRKCGIANFTKDLINSFTCDTGETQAFVAAIGSKKELHHYSSPVEWRIDENDPKSFRRIGKAMNKSPLDVILLQHEFGIFGTPAYAEPMIDNASVFLDQITDKPIVTTLHTVLPQPKDSVKRIIRDICEKSTRVIVMAHMAGKILIEDYGIPEEKIVVISHGVPMVSHMKTTRKKQALHLGSRPVLSTFGLLAPVKGLEYVISALPEIKQQFSDILYVIIGQTHPKDIQKYGESYRERLKQMAKDLGVEENVQFINRYISQQQIINYLQATDIYITPYLTRNQISSGTLSYALGCSKPCVSTPYLYATEVLAEGRGLLTEFADSASIARCVKLYLSDKKFTQDVRDRVAAYSKEMSWLEVGKKYQRLLEEITASQSSDLFTLSPSLTNSSFAFLETK